MKVPYLFQKCVVALFFVYLFALFFCLTVAMLRPQKSSGLHFDMSHVEELRKKERL